MTGISAGTSTPTGTIQGLTTLAGLSAGTAVGDAYFLQTIDLAGVSAGTSVVETIYRTLVEHTSTITLIVSYASDI